MTIEDSNIERGARGRSGDFRQTVDRRFVVMGVCASGKTTFGQMLAERLGAEFIDGDDLHPAGNVQKMSAGEPLNDDDRAPWLEAIRDSLARFRSQNRAVVIACSALKKAYRELLRQGDADLQLIFLDMDKALILNRISDREGHFMKTGMVDSQFATLERPDDEPGTIRIYKSKAVEAMIDDCLAEWRDARGI